MTTQQLTADLTTALQAHYPAPEAQAIAALVAEHLLGFSPLQRRMQAAAPVPAAVQAQLPAVQARLLAHEPVQYVLGTAHFAGLELEVTPATLIPRPETEELVQLIARAYAGQPGLRLLDVGTGSGCLAIALALALPRPARVVAVDISAGALAVAGRNAARYAPLVELQQVDILQELPAGLPPGSLDIFVSNPPYVRESERAVMRANVLAWEPATALFVPDDDPLRFYRRLGELGLRLLRPGGGLYLEINEALSDETQALLRGQGYAAVRGVNDMFDRPRMVVAIRS
ncbi:peptide chain release factor N(5)-glutamine methyltransferase [Hymenobacter sp. UV11]|uniref:peptide chain release factor N(5)-glutamine methyltransferase n=1 Tax=Hymenobacter sp. UV11 TaxID=1849735 RepID=UPI00106159E4|nr:peptide chain release factor N(5)-glutamine methyltransferase [Hymenobacter sp. UV11]TDN36336.1 protein-(glutamine-N5) methyltransferase, release factor-specific [Hymenobacter sp. UV11]TFZ67050.1 peptide chain release factor N(5)-glutamine methyltransferase [Hymenobacter sp. UV11]